MALMEKSERSTSFDPAASAALRVRRRREVQQRHLDRKRVWRRRSWSANARTSWPQSQAHLLSQRALLQVLTRQRKRAHPNVAAATTVASNMFISPTKSATKAVAGRP